MSDKPFDGTRRVVASGGRDTSNDFDNPAFGDEVIIQTDHRGGPRPEGSDDDTPITISPEAYENILDNFNQFLGGRIMSRLQHGKNAERIDVKIEISIEEEGERDLPNSDQKRGESSQ